MTYMYTQKIVHRDFVSQHCCQYKRIVLVLFLFNIPFNNFSVILGQSHCFLGIYQYFGNIKVSCSGTLYCGHFLNVHSYHSYHNFCNFTTEKPEQTVKTPIKLLLEDQSLHCPPFAYIFEGFKVFLYNISMVSIEFRQCYFMKSISFSIGVSLI